MAVHDKEPDAGWNGRRRRRLNRFLPCLLVFVSITSFLAGTLIGRATDHRLGKMLDTIVVTPQGRPAQERIDFSGRIFYSDGTPCANQRIELHSAPIRSATDSEGIFYFKDVETGKHTLSMLDESGRELNRMELLIERDLGVKTGQMKSRQVEAGQISGADSACSLAVAENVFEIHIQIRLDSEGRLVPEPEVYTRSREGIYRDSAGGEAGEEIERLMEGYEGTGYRRNGVQSRAEEDLAGQQTGNGEPVTPEDLREAKDSEENRKIQETEGSAGVRNLEESAEVRSPEGDAGVQSPEESAGVRNPYGSTEGQNPEDGIGSGSGEIQGPGGSPGDASGGPGGFGSSGSGGGGSGSGGSGNGGSGSGGSGSGGSGSGGSGNGGSGDPPSGETKPTEPDRPPDVTVEEKGGPVWTQHTAISLFADRSGSGREKKLMPGSKGSYAFLVYNNNPYSIRYQMKIHAPEGQLPLPLCYRLKSEEGYLCGDGHTWLTADELAAAAVELPAGRTKEYLLEWQWLYEGGDDEADTRIGSSADLEYEVIVTIECG